MSNGIGRVTDHNPGVAGSHERLGYSVVRSGIKLPENFLVGNMLNHKVKYINSFFSTRKVAIINHNTPSGISCAYGKLCMYSGGASFKERKAKKL